MRYGVEIVTLGPLADPRRAVELAVAAEDAGFELVAPVQGRIARLREAGAPVGSGFEIAMTGVSHGPGVGGRRPYAEAGVTWWLESLSPSYGELEELRSRVRAGPPG